jgi:LacI family transcriptional regulator
METLMPTTLKDVAIAAGVSIRTVSRVVNNQGEIGEDTRQRIWEIIHQLSYRPNQLARGLITGKTLTIGVIIPDITDPFFPEFILSVESTARDRNYNVFLCNANRQPDIELKYVDLLSQRQVDGFIMAGSQLNENDLVKAINGYKAVILTPYFIPDTTIFTIHDFDGGRQIGEHLLELGHRRVGYVEGTWSKSALNRKKGLVSAFDQAGVKDAVTVTSIYPATAENSRTATKEFLNRYPEVTALVGYNDNVALGILQACRELGKNVPKEISIVGFDDIPEASRSTPTLTSFHIDRVSLGSEMMTALLDEIEGKEIEHKQIMVEGHLVIRESTVSVSIA